MLSIKQRQQNLQFLGYYKGKIDGIEGAQTKQAYGDFQRDYGLVEDKIYGIKTDAKLIEVIKAIQAKINTKADGLVGSDTIAKCKEYQLKNGLTVDGICGVKTRAKLNSTASTSSSWDDIKYFKKSEFDCKCGCGLNNIDLKLVKILDEIRGHFGKPMLITCGCRCSNYNKKVGGIANSKHLRGKAADIWISGVSKTALLNKCREYVANGRATYTYTNSTNMARAVHIDIA